MKIDLKLKILNSKGAAFLGPGPVELLRRVALRGSINKAAKDMDMSYMKALRLVNGIETNVGRKLVIRRAGGPEGGGSDITPAARALLVAYDKLEQNVLAYARKRFDSTLARMI